MEGGVSATLGNLRKHAAWKGTHEKRCITNWKEGKPTIESDG